MNYKETIAAAYDKGVDEEYNRLVSTPLFEAEYMLISELMGKYIENGSVAIDIGAGPGRYAEYLLQKNCKVGTVDLSVRSLNFFYDRISEKYHHNILFNNTCCATKLDWIENEKADAVLMMGPMYHLINENERFDAIKHAFRILKPGGVIFVVFMSPYPLLTPINESSPEILNSKDFNTILSNNYITKVRFMDYNVEQFRCWPSYATNLMNICGFIQQRIYNIDGIESYRQNDKKNNQTNDKFKTDLLNTAYNTGEKQNILGFTEQYLYIGKKQKL